MKGRVSWRLGVAKPKPTEIQETLPPMAYRAFAWVRICFAGRPSSAAVAGDRRAGKAARSCRMRWSMPRTASAAVTATEGEEARRWAITFLTAAMSAPPTRV
ncbi:hypothetical protein [Streptomyces sp. MMBL 11-3]|uniref:hypothetical protein n=1 Tax=Streptomyces sp. MMBL 11-3 TaxID=3382639 RepID=UPI0039B6DAC1